MKKLFLPALVGLVSMPLLTGCLHLQFGGGTTNQPPASKPSQPPTINQSPTVGQQLVDLKAAKDAGAITEAEYEAKKAKLLSGN
jgi:hypothetical protein